jgi:hypothetical protein
MNNANSQQSTSYKILKVNKSTQIKGIQNDWKVSPDLICPLERMQNKLHTTNQDKSKEFKEIEKY